MAMQGLGHQGFPEGTQCLSSNAFGGAAIYTVYPAKSKSDRAITKAIPYKSHLAISSYIILIRCLSLF